MSDDGSPWRLTIEPDEHGLERLRVALELDDRVRMVRRLGGGLGAATHLLRSGDRHIVVKQYPRDRRESVAREWEGLVYASDHGLPVPIPLAVDGDGAWFGCPTIAMSHLRGAPELRPRQLDAFVGEVVDLMLGVHAVEIDAAPRSFRRPGRVERWEHPGEVPDGILPVTLVEQVASRIDDLARIAEPEPPVFSHGDFHPGNLLSHRDQIAGLVDWSTVQIGTRSAEVAYFRIELATLIEPSAGDQFLDRYQQRYGMQLANQQLHDLLHVYSGHQWAHAWLEGWHAQGKPDLDLSDVGRRLVLVAEHVLAATTR
jgi:aminoglycoside phosphotransferase (APT) family kinase protein